MVRLAGLISRENYCEVILRNTTSVVQVWTTIVELSKARVKTVEGVMVRVSEASWGLQHRALLDETRPINIPRRRNGQTNTGGSAWAQPPLVIPKPLDAV